MHVCKRENQTDRTHRLIPRPFILEWGGRDWNQLTARREEIAVSRVVAGEH